MFRIADLLRAAGNVLLTPVELEDLEDAPRWQRGVLAGSGRQGTREAAAQMLRRVSPDIELDSLNATDGWASLARLRRRRYDVACLLLTGEAAARAKALALLSGARTVIALGRSGQWYLVRRPPVVLSSPRWWARAALTVLLCGAYLLLLEAILVSDALARALSAPQPLRDPGPARGRTVTFIVPTYNQRHLMDFCLPPLLSEAGREHSVVVVDDGSDDATAEHVRQAYRRVKVLRLEENMGFAAAVAAGVAASTTPLIALVNSDVELRPGFLDHILPHFDDEDVFAVCARIQLADGSLTETGRVAPAFSGLLEPYHLPPTDGGDILFAGGACSVFHRERFLALGGLDSLYHPFYWEDIDLGWNAWRRGWRSVFEPRASVLHLRRGTIGAEHGEARANEIFLRNSLVFVWKNLRDRGLLAQHLVYVWARLAREILAGDGMLCRALLAALPRLPRALMARRRVWRRGDLPDTDILERANPARREDRR